MRRILLIGAGVLLAAGVWAWGQLERPYAGFTGTKRLEIPRGTSATEMAALLVREGVLPSEWQFLLLRLVRPGTTLQAGEYEFSGESRPREVFDRIARGDVFFYELRVPEGSNMFDIARSVEALGVMRATEFLAGASDPTLIRDLAPAAPSLEGYLFPSTYRITRHTTAAQLCRQMTNQFRQKWKELGTRSKEIHSTVTLASLVEKETAVAEERPLVASVFQNRLNVGIKLDCDPTTIYAARLEDRYDGVIHQSDLASRNRYNTYQHAGLPPGPIANPGVSSLRAAIEPAQTDFLYFVAKPGVNGETTGAHQFSTSLAEHERAVGRFRRGQKNGVQKKPAHSVARAPKSRRR